MFVPPLSAVFVFHRWSVQAVSFTVHQPEFRAVRHYLGRWCGVSCLVALCAPVLSFAASHGLIVTPFLVSEEADRVPFSVLHFGSSGLAIHYFYKLLHH